MRAHAHRIIHPSSHLHRHTAPLLHDRKEHLWPYVREFADNSIQYVQQTMQKLQKSNERCELYYVHGHYADAGEAAALISYTLGCDMVLTGHSLGRNKLDHLLKSGGLGLRTKQSVECSHSYSTYLPVQLLVGKHPCNWLLLSKLQQECECHPLPASAWNRCDIDRGWALLL